MRIPVLAALALCLFSGPARADLEYAFNVASASGALQPFSFSFTAPAFLANNDAPTFTPFTVTNGVDSWTLTQGLAFQSAVACFAFGTTTGSVLQNNCTIGTDGLSQSAALLLDVGATLPTATGVYNFAFAAFVEDSTAILDLTGSLDITSIAAVPEPASIGLLGSMLAFVGWKLSRRYAPRPS